jgi:hypothetical protein
MPYKKKTNPIRSDKKPKNSDPTIKKRNPIRVNYCPNPIRIRSDSDRIRTPLFATGFNYCLKIVENYFAISLLNIF